MFNYTFYLYILCYNTMKEITKRYVGTQEWLSEQMEGKPIIRWFWFHYYAPVLQWLILITNTVLIILIYVRLL